LTPWQRLRLNWFPVAGTVLTLLSLGGTLEQLHEARHDIEELKSLHVDSINTKVDRLQSDIDWLRDRTTLRPGG